MKSPIRSHPLLVVLVLVLVLAPACVRPAMDEAALKHDWAADGGGPAAVTWRRANLTWYTSYPEPGSEEWNNYNGGMWAGYFAFVSGKQPESWVAANNIAAVHSDHADTYKLKTLRLRQGTRQIDVKVYDKCADSDCNGCCTANSRETGFLIDLESYTKERFGSGHGIVEWTCLDCQ